MTDIIALIIAGLALLFAAHAYRQLARERSELAEVRNRLDPFIAKRKRLKNGRFAKSN